MKNDRLYRVLGTTFVSACLACTVSAQSIVGNDGFFPAIIKADNACFIQGKMKTDRSEVTTTKVPLVVEDFSAMVSGTEEQPDLQSMLASSEGKAGEELIDPALTSESTWTGNRVYPAGGCVALMLPEDVSYYDRPCINTPYGDYSGVLTISFRAKKMKTEAADINVSVLIGGFKSADYANADKPSNVFVIEEDVTDWQEFSFEVRNYSANNSGFIQFSSFDDVLIDDISVIVSSDEFIACPVLLPATNYTDSTFTANWERVRAANTYVLGLSKRIWLAEEDTVFFQDSFDDGTIPANYVTTGAIVSEGGYENTAGISLVNNQMLSTPVNNANYHNAVFFMTVVPPEGYDGTSSLGVVSYSFQRDGQWIEYGSFDLMRYVDNANMIDMNIVSYGDFSNKCTGLRFDTENMPEGCSVIFDEFDISTDRPFEMETVFTIDDWMAYVSYPATSYTFTGLEPDGDYFFSVVARRYDVNSEPVTGHAFGLAAPEALQATNVDLENGTFTANWGQSVKATRYKVNLSARIAVEDDIDKFAVLSENFDKVDAEVTDSVKPESPEILKNYFESLALDEYTQLPGWSGYSTALAQGWLGCSMRMFSSANLTTPVLDLENDDHFYLTLNALGTSGDQLRIAVQDSVYFIPFDENGVIDGEYEFYNSGSDVQITFSSSGGVAFMLDYVQVAQDVKKGDVVHIYLEGVETDAETFSHMFEGLGESGYDTFSYRVLAYWDEGGDTAVSAPSHEMAVPYIPLGIEENAVDGDVEVVARYTVDGIKIDRPVRGVNILRLSNGRTVKVLVR